MEIGKVYTDGMTVGARQRQLDETKVAAIASSMEAIGLQQPISIWADGDTAHLVAGAHRLAAAIKLGWDEIDCIFVGLNEIDRQIWEIDENLFRNELTTEEMREHLRRRKELWEQRQVGRDVPPAKLKDGRGAGPQHQKSFAAETSESTGMSKRQINRLLADPKPKPAAQKANVTVAAGNIQDTITKVRREYDEFKRVNPEGLRTLEGALDGSLDDDTIEAMKEKEAVELFKIMLLTMEPDCLKTVMKLASRFTLIIGPCHTQCGRPAFAAVVGDVFREPAKVKS